MIDWEKYNRSQAAITGLGFVEVDIKDYEEMRATEKQRDKLVAAIEKHKRTMTMRPDFVDEELWAALD